MKKMTLGRLVLLVVVAWVVLPVVLWQFGASVGERGQFGDMFGMVNALFSGLAFAGLFWALFLQQKQIQLQRIQLTLQRRELKLQREEMKASRAELANQVAAQRELARVTAMQIAAAAGQMNIEALKLECEFVASNSDHRGTLVQQIKAQAKRTAELASGP